MSSRGRIFTVTKDGSLATAVYEYPSLNEEIRQVYGEQNKELPDMKVVMTKQVSKNLEKNMQFPGRHRQTPTPKSVCINDYVEHQMFKKDKTKKEAKETYDLRQWK